MKLFHSFPRPRKNLRNPDANTEVPDYIACRILSSILKNGLLCTPEELKIFPDRQTANRKKRALLLSGEPEYTHLQSRFCVTLCSEKELFERKIRGLTPEETGPTVSDGALLSHADLFGPCAISFEPKESRQIGILPTSYYSPADIFGERFQSSYSEAPGLNLQIIQRLKEIRELMIVLATIERSLVVGSFRFPGEDVLDALKLNLPFQEEVMDAVHKLSTSQRSDVFKLFDTDREMALNLVSFVDIMLSLFQETDSTKDGAILAFYQQREWRLVHHMREGMTWYCLGAQPHFRNPFAKLRQEQIRELRDDITRMTGKRQPVQYLDHCWLLESVDGIPVSDFISSVIVPRRLCSFATQALLEVGSHADVIASEDLGHR
jgi:hypothetical protein